MQLTLYPRITAQHRSQHIGLWIVAALMAIFVIGAVVILMHASAASGKPIDWFDAGRGLLKSMAEDTFALIQLLILVLAAAAQLLYWAWSKGRERLVLDELGIRYVSPMPRAIEFVKPSWSLQWSQIRHIEIKSQLPNPQLMTLVLHTGGAKRTLLPYAWIDPANYRAPSWREQLRPQARKFEVSANEVLDSPLLRFIKALPGRKFELPSAQSIAPFALEKNRAALVVVVLFFMLFIYALIDALIVNSEAYVGEPFYGIYVAGGVAVFALAYIFLRNGSVPVAESIVVAVLTAGAFGAALFPGLLRINQVTDSHGLIEYRYKMTTPGVFVPLTPELPEIDFPERHREFWSQYPAGQVEYLRLRRGALGFYQIEMAALYERIREWYENQR